jgi:hypothetical protein
MFTSRPRACRIEDISCDSSGERVCALISSVMGGGGSSAWQAVQSRSFVLGFGGIPALQALQKAVVLGLIGSRSDLRSLDFFLGEVLWAAARVLELTGSLEVWPGRFALVLSGFAGVGESWREVWVDLFDTFGEVWRCFLTPFVVVGIGEVSRERLRLAAGVGERGFLVFGAIVAVSSRTGNGSRVCGSPWRAIAGLL